MSEESGGSGTELDRRWTLDATRSLLRKRAQFCGDEFCRVRPSGLASKLLHNDEHIGMLNALDDPARQQNPGEDA